MHAQEVDECHGSAHPEEDGGEVGEDGGTDGEMGRKAVDCGAASTEEEVVEDVWTPLRGKGGRVV